MSRIYRDRCKWMNAEGVENKGMPLVDEAVRRMHMGIEEMKVSRVKVVKLIHGYGSTGRGGFFGPFFLTRYFFM